MSHLYGDRTETLGVTEWASFIEAMMEYQLIDPDTAFTASNCDTANSELCEIDVGDVPAGEVTK